MIYEVEKKFPVADLAALRSQLETLGASSFEEQTEVDTYYAHPSKNFRETDEALRIRRIGDHNRVTYKGPRIDRETKTRHEIELPLGEGDANAAAWDDLLTRLEFRAVGRVQKARTSTQVEWQNRRVTVTLDDVDRLGTYCELELTAPPEEVEEAKAVVNSLAEHLKLTGNETRSYLNLLMAKHGEDVVAKFG